MKTNSKLKILNFITKRSFSKWSPSRKGSLKFYSNRPILIENPVIEKPLLSKALDNEKCPEIDYIDDLKNEQNNPLASILSDMQTDNKPIFTLKSNAFPSISECLDFLKNNKENFANNNIFRYLERIFLTLINSNAKEVKETLKKEENQQVISEFCNAIEDRSKNSLHAFFPQTRDIKKTELRELLEIKELARIFVYILHDYLTKNINDLESRKIIDLLRNWEDLFYLYLHSKSHKQKLTELLQISFEKFNQNIEKLTFKEKIMICHLMRNIKYADNSFLDWMVIYCELNFDKLDLGDIISVLYLGNKVQKVVPFELLYRTKKQILANYKKIGPRNLLRILEVYSKKRIFFAERLIETVFNEISQEKIFTNLSNIDYVLFLYHYSNSKYRDETLFEKILKKIEERLEELKTSQNLHLVMLSMAHLNYTNSDFFEKVNQKINLLELVENVKKSEEELYDEEKEYFKMLLRKIQENSSQGQTHAEEGKPKEEKQEGRNVICE